MNITKVIKTEDDYRTALARAGILIEQDPDSGSYEAEQLELLALLIEDYEKKSFSFSNPDPISAIEFRMEQQGLRQRDLIPILGSRSRVSEVLGRKRPLTIQMIRALSEELGIAAEVLIRPSELDATKIAKEDDPDWIQFPYKEMQRRGWIPSSPAMTSSDIEELVKSFLHSASRTLPNALLYRRKISGLGFDSAEEKTRYSCLAWSARVLSKANATIPRGCLFNVNAINTEFLREIAKFSAYQNGPTLVVEKLKRSGIFVVFEPALPGSLVDGVALLNDQMIPVIGLSLRYDRIDYFWFTLMHEIAHIWKHLSSPKDMFIDRIDAPDQTERNEKEANRIAREALIPRSIWFKSIARVNASKESILELASEAGVHPAIVAGRVRYESENYTKFTNMLGSGTIRPQFESEM